MPRPRKKALKVNLPDWVDETDDLRLRSVAEDVYFAKARVDRWTAKRCQNSSYRQAAKSLRKLENEKLSTTVRCREGDQAALKFLEAELNLLESRLGIRNMTMSHA